VARWRRSTRPGSTPPRPSRLSRRSRASATTAAPILLGDGEEACAKSFRNIDGVSVLHVDDVGVADLVAAARLVVSEAALERLTRLAS